MRFSHRLLTTVAFALLVTAGSSSAALAAPQSPQDTFKLTITKANNGKVVSSATLRCHPNRGNHPDSAAACKDLTKVDGKIQNIHSVHAACPALYDPVIAEAHGRWHGHDRSYRHKFGNRCEAQRGTGGHVFNLR